MKTDGKHGQNAEAVMAQITEKLTAGMDGTVNVDKTVTAQFDVTVRLRWQDRIRMLLGSSIKVSSVMTMEHNPGKVRVWHAQYTVTDVLDMLAQKALEWGKSKRR